MGGPVVPVGRIERRTEVVETDKRRRDKGLRWMKGKRERRRKWGNEKMNE